MKRTLTLGAAWLASAAGAVGLGFLAVSLVDASAAPGTSPVAASTSATAEPSEGTPEPTTASPSPRVTGEFATLAGTVYANCTSGQPVLAGVPTVGWWVDDSNKAGEVEFENGTEKLEVYVACSGTTPQFSVEGPRADGSGREDGTTTPASPSTSDHSGRDGSGGDDSSGRGGGGHGSDDDSSSSSDDSGGDSSGHGGSDDD